MAEDTARILVVDDEKRVCLGLKETLEHDNHVVITAFSGEAALELLRDTYFDAAVIDLNLGGDVDGLQVLGAIRWRWPDMAAIVLTGYGSLESAIAAIRNGVDDYLLKPAGPDQVLKAVRRALAARASRKEQNAAETAHVVRRGGFCVDLGQHLATRDGRRLDLPPQEVDLLIYLMQNAHRVVSPREMVRAIREFEPESSHEARQIIKWYVHRLRRAIEPDPSHPCHVVNVRGVGYRFQE
jgi:two-component system KDP operon response regulator KdpE